jgi:hypothetical protein
MEIQASVDFINKFKQNSNTNAVTKDYSTLSKDNEQSSDEKSLDEIINESAVKVSLSMNAQYILFAMNTSSTTKDNTLTQASLSTNQQEVLDFLAGKESGNGMSLENIGYEGKPITELSQEEAKDLVSEEGFFGVNQTSQRVADFVFGFSGNDLELLQKGREGIVQGFEDAKKLFGGELPEISYKTQERTLALIDEKINSLKGE